MGEYDLPMPDIAVAHGTIRDYATKHPTSAQVWLVVEVADTTLLSDRRRKVPLYANAGIRECWIVNLPERQVGIFRDPQNGIYQTTFIETDTGTISPLAAPTSLIAVADLLP